MTVPASPRALVIATVSEFPNLPGIKHMVAITIVKTTMMAAPKTAVENCWFMSVSTLMVDLREGRRSTRHHYPQLYLRPVGAKKL
jgi:hypothetical protein